VLIVLSKLSIRLSHSSDISLKYIRELSMEIIDNTLTHCTSADHMEPGNHRVNRMPHDQDTFLGLQMKLLMHNHWMVGLYEPHSIVQSAFPFEPMKLHL